MARSDAPNITSVNGTGTSAVLSKPTGVVLGVFLVAQIAVEGSATITAPSGWSLTNSFTAGGLKSSVYTKMAGGAEPSTYTWTFNSSQQYEGKIVPYYGISPTLSVTASTGAAFMAAGTSIGLGTLTSLVPGSIELFFAATPFGTTYTPPAGFDELYDRQSGSGAGHISIGLFERFLSAAGATGTVTATQAASTTRVGHHLILRPTLGRTVPVTAVLSTHGERTVPSTAVLLASKSRDVPTTAVLIGTYSRTVPVQAVLEVPGGGGTFTRDVPVEAVLLASKTRTVPTTAVLLASLSRIVPTSAVLLATKSRSVPVSAVLSRTATRSIPTTAALLATLARSVPATAVLLGSYSRSVPVQAVLEAEGVTQREVPVTAVLLRSLSRPVPVSAVLLASLNRSVPTTAALLRSLARSVPVTAVLEAGVLARYVPVTAVLSGGAGAVVSMDLADAYEATLTLTDAPQLTFVITHVPLGGSTMSVSNREYVIGGRAKVTDTIRNDSSVLADPTGLTVEIIEPGQATGTTYTYGTDAEVVKDSTGVYHVLVDLDEYGIYTVYWQSTSPRGAARLKLRVINKV